MACPWWDEYKVPKPADPPSKNGSGNGQKPSFGEEQGDEYGYGRRPERPSRPGSEMEEPLRKPKSSYESPKYGSGEQSFGRKKLGDDNSDDDDDDDNSDDDHEEENSDDHEENSDDDEENSYDEDDYSDDDDE